MAGQQWPAFCMNDPSLPQFIAIHSVRSGIVTAAASLTTGTATSLVAGDTDYFLDIVELTVANNSSAAATVALTNDGTTIRTFQAPANSSFQLIFDAPLKQNTKGIAWLADMEDVTGTTVSIGANLVKRNN